MSDWADERDRELERVRLYADIDRLMTSITALKAEIERLRALMRHITDSDADLDAIQQAALAS